MNNFSFDEPIDFYNYINSDKSKYKSAREAGYIDPNDDFLVGDSGGFLLNIEFTFVDTHLLQPAANFYMQYGKYTFEDIDSPAYTKFRLQEEHRREFGYTAKCKKLKDGSVVDLHITGDHYNFINYGRMLKLNEASIKNNTAEKKEGFPRFIDAQYWWFKIKQFATDNGFNEIVCKTRRGGFSYSEAIDTANEINLKPKLTVILAASDKKYLIQGNAISPMVLNQILFYESDTPFVRGLIKRDLENIKLGFKDPSGNDVGWLSRAIVVSTALDPNAAVGKDGRKVKCEEMGTFDNFDDFATQTMPTLRTGAFITGKLTGFGTINSDNTSREVFSKNFYNPAKWFFMPFENVWDKNKRNTVCGYYKPYWWGLEGSVNGTFVIDKDGNTNYSLAVKLVEEEQKYKWETVDTLKEYADYIGQYGNRPSDSFGAAFNNIFVSEGLIRHIANVENNTNEFTYWKDGKYESFKDERGKIQSVSFVTNEQLFTQDRKSEIHEYITELKPNPNKDNYGCVREYMPPLRDFNNEIPKDLYRIWVDPYGVDKNTNKEITDDNSFGVIGVYMNPTNIRGEKGDRIVAMFVGRPPKQEDFDRIILMLSYRYNAKVFTENDRGQVVQDFRLWGEYGRLVTEPSLAWDVSLKGSDGREVGISMGQGGGNRRLSGIGFHKEWLYTPRGINTAGDTIYNYHTINDIGILKEYKNFNSTGNFDRISMLIVGAYDIKELNYQMRSFIDGMSPKRESADSIFKRQWYK